MIEDSNIIISALITAPFLFFSKYVLTIWTPLVILALSTMHAYFEIGSTKQILLASTVKILTIILACLLSLMIGFYIGATLLFNLIQGQ